MNILIQSIVKRIAAKFDTSYDSHIVMAYANIYNDLIARSGTTV